MRTTSKRWLVDWVNSLWPEVEEHADELHDPDLIEDAAIAAIAIRRAAHRLRELERDAGLEEAVAR